MMKNKLQYKKAIRDKECNSSLTVTNELHETLIKKDFNNFWKSWKKKLGPKHISNDCVNGMINNLDIAEEFANCFEKQ